LLLLLAGRGVDWAGEGAWGPLREANREGVDGGELEGSMMAVVAIAQAERSISYEVQSQKRGCSCCEVVDTKMPVCSFRLVGNKLRTRRLT